MTELPKYKCHKTVHALRIKDIVWDADNRPTHLSFHDEGYAPRPVTMAWVTKHDPKPGGYLVVYDDGYESFSPAKAFEDGYTRI